MVDPEIFLDWRIAIYIGGVVVLQIICWIHFRRKKNKIAAAREAHGLPSGILLNNSVQLDEARRESLLYAIVLLFSVLLLPFILVWLGGDDGADKTSTTNENTGLAITFIVLLFWVFFNATEISKAYLGGLAFKTLAAFQVPFQVGDRASFQGVEGKVLSIGTFFTTLQTQNDDKISVPTASLWQTPIISVNGSSRSSLCVMNFYLSSRIEKDQRIGAENKIWDAIQSSTYFEPTQPPQIYLHQEPDYIRLTAKAYVASTYREPQFTSDVTRSFLNYANEEKLLPDIDKR